MAEIFRKSALERRATPDTLDDYINVSNPGIWLVLVAIIAFLVGLLTWGIFGNVEEVRHGVIHVDHGLATCYVDQTKADLLDAGDTVNVSGVEGSVVSVSPVAMSTSTLSTKEQQLLGSSTTWVVAATLSIKLPDGTYDADVTVASISPFKLLFSSGK